MMTKKMEYEGWAVIKKLDGLTFIDVYPKKYIAETEVEEDYLNETDGEAKKCKVIIE